MIASSLVARRLSFAEEKTTLVQDYLLSKMIQSKKEKPNKDHSDGVAQLFEMPLCVESNDSLSGDNIKQDAVTWSKSLPMTLIAIVSYNNMCNYFIEFPIDCPLSPSYQPTQFFLDTGICCFETKKQKATRFKQTIPIVAFQNIINLLSKWRKVIFVIAVFRCQTVLAFVGTSSFLDTFVQPCRRNDTNLGACNCSIVFGSFRFFCN